MQEALITALKERIIAGYNEATIISEMIAMGYSETEAQKAYEIARGVVPEAGASTMLLTVTEYVEQVWVLAKSELPVFGKTVLVGVGAFVVVALAIFIIASTLGFGVGSSFWTTALIVPFIAALVAGIMTFALTRALLLRRTGALFRTHIHFVLTNFLSLALVTLYLTLLTQVGYAFFVIPGVLAAVYFMFAIPLVLTGEAKGITTLTESARLVHGRFWSVLGRFVVLNIIAVATVFLCAFVLSLLATGAVAQGVVFGMASFPPLFAGVIGAVVAAVYFMSCGTVVLFEDLKRTPSPTPMKEQTLVNLRTLFRIIIAIVIGLFCLLAFGLGFAGYAFFS